jgi:hypothetical protein
MSTGNEPTLPADPPEDTGRHPDARHADQPRDARGHFIGTIDADRKAAQCARLRADNPKMTWQQIADAVGYSSKGDAWRAAQKCRQAVLKSAGAELVASEAQQLDDLYVMAMEVIEANHVVVSHGRVVTMLDPETQEEKPLADSGPKLQAIQAALRIRESYRKLHGLDAEQKISVAGSVRYEVVGVDPADLT